MEDIRDWTGIYGNGWEEVRIKAEPDNSLHWALSDCAGPLEELVFHATDKVRKVAGWLESHRIDHVSYDEYDAGADWEWLMHQCKDADVEQLVKMSRKTGRLAL